MADRQIPHDLARLYTDFAILKTAMVGIDGKNGLKGEFNQYAQRTEEKIREINHNIGNLSQKFDSFIDESREQRAQISSEIRESHHDSAPCYGLAELRRRDEQSRAREAQDLAFQQQSTENEKTIMAQLKIGRNAIIVTILATLVTLFVNLIIRG